MHQGVSSEKLARIRERDPMLVQAAEQMEALFIDQLYQAMRQAVPESEFSLENHATKIYKSMLDSELAKNAAKAHSLGLSELLVAHLESQRYAQEGSGNQAVVHGGTNENPGKPNSTVDKNSSGD